MNIDGSAGSYRGPLTFTDTDSMSGFANTSAFVIYTSLDARTPASIEGAVAVTSPWSTSQSNNLTVHCTNLAPQRSQLPSDGQIYTLFSDTLGRISMAKSPLLTYKSVDPSAKTLTTDTTMLPDIAAILASNYSMSLMVLIYEHWTSSYHRVRHIDRDADSETITLTLSTAPSQYVNDAASGKRFYLVNSAALLSSSDSFYFNASTLDLCVATEAEQSVQRVLFATDAEVLQVQGAARMQFRALHVRYSAADFAACLSSTCMAQSAAFLQTATVHVSDAQQVVFDGVNVTYTGGYAVWLDRGTRDSRFVNGRVQNVGAGGIRVGVNAGLVCHARQATCEVLSR